MLIILRYIILISIFYFLFRRLKVLFSYSTAKNGPRGSQNSENRKNQYHEKKSPYEILEISRGASKEQIKLAYKKLMSQYHPDKVAHLGADLQALAMKKTQEITWAYKQLQP